MGSGGWLSSVGATNNYFGPLTQGQKYYIQMVQHEGTGGDNASATFSIFGSATYPDPTANGRQRGSLVT